MHKFRKFVNVVIGKIKGENYEMDNDIPIGYLFCHIFSKISQLRRGFCTRINFKRHNKGKRVFIGKHVKIKDKKNISCGTGVTIGDYSYINALSRCGIKIGNNVSLSRNSQIECTGVISNLGEGLFIGNNVGIAPNCFISCRGPINIGDNCILGPNVHLYAENHNYSDINVIIRLQGENRRGITVKENCWIGANVTILDGVTIGKGCVIGAGSVVTKSFGENLVIVGNPARVLKIRTKK